MRLLGNQIRLSKNAAAELDLTGGWWWGGDPVHSGFLGSDSVFGTPPAPPWHVQEEDGAPPPRHTREREADTHHLL